MTEKDWIIFRLLRALTPQFGKLTPKGQRDYTKALLYVIKEHGVDAVHERIDALKEEP